MADEDKGFLGRWSARKVAVKEGKPVAEPAVQPMPAVIPAHPVIPAQAGIHVSSPSTVDSHLSGNDSQVPALTLDDVAALTPTSDFSTFVAKGVDSAVKNAAMKKLFTDPHYNIMDGLDIYIGDYSTHAPMPQSVIDEITKDGFLNMFRKEEISTEMDDVPPESPPPTESLSHDNPDLQLQRDNAAGRKGAIHSANQSFEVPAGLETPQPAVPPPSP